MDIKERKAKLMKRKERRDMVQGVAILIGIVMVLSIIAELVY